MKNLEKAFNLFCSDEEFRKNFHTPFFYQKKVFATDLYTMIFTDKKNCKFQYKTVFETPLPPVTNVIPEPNTNRIIDLSIIDFEKFKTDDVYAETDVLEIQTCPICEGDGLIECDACMGKECDECNNEGSHECDECDGKGYCYVNKLEKTGEKTFNDRTFIKIDHAFFKISLFYRLKQVADLLENNTVKIIFAEPFSSTKPFLFEIGFCKILIMPYINNINQEEENYSCIKFIYL